MFIIFKWKKYKFQFLKQLVVISVLCLSDIFYTQFSVKVIYAYTFQVEQLLLLWSTIVLPERTRIIQSQA